MDQSTFQPERKLFDYPRAIAYLVDALGWSVGGAHTTVCGYAIPERPLFNTPLCGYSNRTELPDAAAMLDRYASTQEE
jgi:hypothetical protein